MFKTNSIVLCVMLLSQQALSQGADGRWSIGIHAGPNMWANDMNKRKVGLGGEVAFRYNLSEWFSLGVATGYEELKAAQDPLIPGLASNYLKLHFFPASVIGSISLSPGSDFSPYVYAGIGGGFYVRRDGLGTSVPDGNLRTSLHVPVGVGFESFTSTNVSLLVDLGYRILDDQTDNFKFNLVDSYPSVKAGVKFYLGTSSEDADDDGDGLTNAEELDRGTDPRRVDTDGDGLTDGEEVKSYFTNPLRPDTDGDGLSDREEIMSYKTDPLKADTDGDGLSDGDEVLKLRTDPLRIDTDGDGLSDGEEIMKYRSDPLKPDTDGDGLSDGDEIFKYKTNPRHADSDGGGIDDGIEVSSGTNPLNPTDDVTQGMTMVLETVYFDFDRANLRPDAIVSLEKVARVLEANPEIEVLIIGHTDSVGADAYNMELSIRRAVSVKSWLAKKGIASKRMKAIGRGEREPAGPNSTPEGRQRNRRVDFEVKN